MMRASGIVPAAVIRKDVRLRMQGWRWAGVTSVYVAILGVIAVGFLLQKYGPISSDAAHIGVQLFQALAIFQLLLIVFVTPASMAGVISGERQHRTWDLLLLSRLSALDIVLGKLLAGIAFNFLLIAASLPLYALVFLFGGVTAVDVVRTFAVFLATVVFLGAVSVAVSALTARLTVSYMASMLIAMLLVVGLSLLTLYVQAPGQIGVLTLGSIPFQTVNVPFPLTPLAHIDPFVALLSALPDGSGGSVLGDLGTVHHAFRLPWQLPLWGAYVLLALLFSLILVLATASAVRRPGLRRVHRPGLLTVQGGDQ